MANYPRFLWRVLTWLILLGLPVSGFGADKVLLQLKWFHQFQFAGYYAAKEKGFYAAEGLDVEFRQRDIKTSYIDDVLEGKADYGTSDAGLLFSRLQGKPVVVLAQIFQHSPLVLLTLKESGLRSPYQLAGKKVMIDTIGFSDAPANGMLFKTLGGFEKFQPTQMTFRYEDLSENKVDAIVAYVTDQPFKFQEAGVEVNILDPRDYGIDFYGDNLFTTEKEIREHPQRVKKMIRATLKGWQYALEHRDEIIELILKKYNPQKLSRQHLLYEAEQTAKMIVPNFVELGSLEASRFTKIAETYVALGLTDQTKVAQDFLYASKKSLVELTPEEQAWLAAHPRIVVGGETDWAPFDFVDESGRYAGVAKDYLQVIGEKLGIEVEIVTGPSWDELLTMIRRKEIDVLPAIYHSAERETFVRFSDPYLKLTEFIFTRSDNRNITSMVDLQDKTTVVVKGYTIEAELRSNYPTHDLITAPTIQDALKKLVTGEADAFIGDIISTSYNIKELSLVGIRPTAAVPFRGPTVHMAVRKDWPVLATLIDKALKAIPEGEHNAIKNQWISFAEKKIEQISPKVSLTAAEQRWITQHPVIRVHNEKDWPPFNYFEYGRPRGLSIDYMDLLANNLGIDVEYVSGPSWNEFLGMVKRKELDVMLNIVKTEDRQKYLLYTEPYVKNPNVIVSFQKNPYETIGALFGKTVSFPKGFFYEEVLTKSYPQIRRLPVEDTLASLKAVAFGRADAALGEAAVVRTLINKNLLTGLRISGEVNIGNPDLTNLRLAVRDDWPLLQSALMKAMAAVTPEEMNQIHRKWLLVDKQKAVEAAASNLAIPLSTPEIAWLAEHPTIRFTGDPDWLPQEAFTDTGQYIGIVADILDLMEANLGVRFERVAVDTWNEAVRLAETGEVDVLSETTSSERDTMTFTKPYLIFPVVILAERGAQPVLDPGQLKGQRVAVVKDYGYVIPFRRQFPQLDYVVVETVRDGLLRLSAGEVDAFISAAPTAYHLMSELGLTNLSVIGATGQSIDLGFGVRKDSLLLVSILNKALASITEEQKLKIRQKWVPVIDTSAAPTAPPISYGRLVGYGIAIFLILILLAWILIRSIRRENIAVDFGSSWFRGLVLAGLSVFVLIAAFAGWYMLERNKTQHLRNVDGNLRGIISVSADRFDLWLKERISYVARLGRDPELVAITKRLLQVNPNKRALLASGALREARFFFRNTGDIFPNIGFFIINPDHMSVGSMRDANLAGRNLISEQNPELLRRAFQGEVGFVPPLTSDVDLGNSSGSGSDRKPPTMFFIGPVQDSDGTVLAVMTLRVDPWKDFARALKLYGDGESRDAYAFDRNGVMLSSSRFDDQLRRIGLLAEGQSSALNIEVRDPGGNMVDGYRPDVARSRQPLTQLIAHTLAMQRQMETANVGRGQSPIESNIEGYRDYRGVPVFGAMLWNADLGIGLAVEVDVAEALSHYYRTRVTIFSILEFTLVLSVGAILFVLIIGERTSRALLRSRDELEDKVVERTEQLAAAEERSRLLLDSVGEGIFGVDLNGKVMFINTAATRLLGYDPAELIGQDVHSKIHHSHGDGSRYPVENCPMARAYSRGSTEIVSDEWLWRKDGSGFPVEYTATPVMRNGEITGAVIAFRDITERKKSEQAVRDSEARLTLAAETGGLGMWEWRVDLDRAIVSDYWLQLKGLTRQAYNRSVDQWEDGLHPADKKRAVDLLNEHLNGDSEHFEVEYRFKHPERGWYWEYATARVIERDANGNPLRMVGYHQDITERKRMEEALSAEHKRLQRILDTSPAGVGFSAADQFHFVNPRFKEMFGVSVGDTTPDIYVNPDEREDLTRRIAGEGRVENHELKMYNRQGQVRDILATFLPITYGGEEGILGWMQDITVRKEAEKAIREKFDELARFRRMAIGREMKMIELKKEINAILAEYGLPAKYKIH